jgi:Zn-dependent protease with chaperone function
MQETITGAALYSDGHIESGRPVQLVFGPTLEIIEDGALRAAWPYADVRRLPGPEGRMRLRAVAAPKKAWVDVGDPFTRREIERRCLLLDGEKEKPNPESRRRLTYGLLIAAAIDVFLWRGVPRMAGWIAPVVPVSWEVKLGETLDEDVRKTFPGKTCDNPKGLAALTKVSERLQEASHLRLPATIQVVSSKIPNAFAMPGGKVYLLSGLLDKSRQQDEVIGVLAHELGHLEHRDHLRRIIATGGTAVFVSLLFGDVTGGAAMIAIGNTLLTASYSRENEKQADDFAAQTLTTLGRPSKPLGELLIRITSEDGDDLPAILHDHPLSEARLSRLAAVDKGTTKPPILSEEEWAALTKICD